jgi:hypothetical protein
MESFKIMSKQIEITFKPDGKVTVEGKNFSGPDCEKASQEIEKALGLTTSKVFKPEHRIKKQVNQR